MNIKTTLKTSVAAAALMALMAPAAQAGGVGSSDAFDTTISGHFNKVALYHDNGEDDGIYQADNSASMSRARIVSKGKINEALSVSGVFEWGMQAATSSSIDPYDGVGAGTANGSESGSTNFFGLRHSYLAFTHKQFGKFTIGHTSEASDGITEINGVGNLQYGTTGLYAGSVTLVNSSTKARGSDVDAFGVSADGTRTSVFRYNTPTFAGITLGVSHSNEQNSGIDAKYSGKFGGIAVDAGIGYKNTAGSSTTQDAQWGGSITVAHDSGISADFSYSELDMVTGTNRDPQGYMVGLGYAADLTSMGKTQFRVAYGESEDATAKDDELTTWVIGVEQAVAKGVAVYGGYQNDSIDQAAGVSYDDVTTVFAGTKVVF